MVKVRDCACMTVTALEPDPRPDARTLDGLVNRCINSAADALGSPTALFSNVQRDHLRHICKSMRPTHETIRDLLKEEHKTPRSVDALPIARMQLETLYAVCLVLDQPTYLDLYLKHSWKQTYILHLLMTAECHNIPTILALLDQQLVPLDQMRVLAGVSEEEKQTIRHEQLDELLPAGGAQRIGLFPSPGAILRLVKDQDRKRMLSRLYFEYQFLCSFVHFGTQPRSFKGIFDEREPFREMFTTGEIEAMFQKQIAGRAIWVDFLSIVQSCAEMTTLYPGDVELRRCVTDAWSILAEKTMMGRAVWEFRAKNLLGVL